MPAMIEVAGLTKSFTLHGQGGVRIPVFAGLGLSVAAGECLALDGPSGSGKSTLLRSLYANYRPDAGAIRVRHGDGVVDMMTAPPHQILAVRRATIGYVSQFLRVIPRVPALAVVAEPLRVLGVELAVAERRAARLLARLRIPERLWTLAPATFSGGEQQRINLARGFIAGSPILLLDEPTASLDHANRLTVIELICAAKQAGTAVVGIFHDREVRDAVADRVFDMSRARDAA
ncbi:MAG: phosphonate C-P lyase system protein PhnL [Azospirillum sp.]|nr:phosphonate C-P lyase system protein PhnL [Azospirillum sp.]